ncbi:MAG: DHH family phosphoesterase [Prevotellaceae bacterium]|nr:DHH family phosphoesterase [Prevotella sp.]MDD7257729.1 DHH family phosphoesterase [Prevotellaceae bacterium]MDY6130617.1 DHH family phosphoesterase [Prevotella sp.]
MNIELLSTEQTNVLHQLISDEEHIVVCCHQNPDGDALGSSLGWAEYLRSQGKDPYIVAPDMFPDYLHWMPGIERVVRYDKHPEAVEEAFMKADLIFCLDYNRPDRMEKLGEILIAATAKKVMIDHHPNPDMDTALTISHPELSSTSEMVFRLVWQLGGFDRMTKKFAAPIYCGMMTDTGGFTYNSTRPEIYFVVSQLLTKGIDKDKIYRNVYNNFSEWRLRLIGYVLYQKLNVFSEKHASYFSLSRNDLRRFHYIKGDAEGLVNMPLQIKGMKLSISLREDNERDNLVWVSLRSVDDFSCTKIAEKYFNGGGHLNASGGRLNCSMDEAERIVRQAISEI